MHKEGCTSTATEGEGGGGEEEAERRRRREGRRGGEGSQNGRWASVVWWGPKSASVSAGFFPSCAVRRLHSPCHRPDAPGGTTEEGCGGGGQRAARDGKDGKETGGQGGASAERAHGEKTTRRRGRRRKGRRKWQRGAEEAGGGVGWRDQCRVFVVHVLVDDRVRGEAKEP
jgi:hypothetical protein